MSVDTKKLMKIPLIIAAALVVLRILSEQAGAPEAVNKIFGVVWLYFIIPFYFAFQITASHEPRPFKALFKNLLIFTFWTRVMVMPTYWLAHALLWSAPRFNRGQSDVVVGRLSAHRLLASSRQEPGCLDHPLDLGGHDPRRDYSVLETERDAKRERHVSSRTRPRGSEAVIWGCQAFEEEKLILARHR